MTAAEKIKEMGIVPVVVLEDEKDAGSAGEGTLRRRASLCGGDISDSGSEGIHPHHAGGISGDVRGSRNCSDNTAGG